MGFRCHIDAAGQIARVTLTAPGTDAHKYRCGALWVLSGPALATGASRLTAQAALAVGAGAVTIVGAEDALAQQAAHVTAIMLHQRPDDLAHAALTLADAGKLAALAVGPGYGVGAACRADVLALLGTGLPIVLDADALTSFAGAPDSLLAALHPRAVLTPHAGEFARLFPDIALDDRAAASAAAAGASGAVVLVKGAVTAIAAPDGRRAVNRHASGWLATAGSGDVLTGLIAGLLAQGCDAFDAACAGAWLHGDIGLRHGPGLTADGMIAVIADVLRGCLEPESGQGDGA